ncbi:MAG: CdaR family protein [Armatimonadota bacterium]
MITQNLFYKLLALVIAIFLWVYVNSERNPQSRKVFSVPVEVRNAARGYTVEPVPAEVSVAIEGPKSAVDTVRREDASAWVDLRELKSGASVVTGKFKVNAWVAGATENQLSVKVSPRSVTVRAEAIRSKRLPVEVKLLTSPPLGYAYTEPSLQPASVGVSGRASAVARVKRVILPVAGDASGKPIDGYFEVTPTDAAGNRVDGVMLDVDKGVHLRLGVVEVPATKAVVVSENIVGRPKFPASILKVSVVPPSVTLEGKPKILMGISTIETEEISVENATDSVTREVALRVPPGVRVVGPPKVRVSVIIGTRE